MCKIPIYNIGEKYKLSLNKVVFNIKHKQKLAYFIKADSNRNLGNLSVIN